MEYERKVESVKMDMLTQSGGSLKELQQKLKLCESKASLFAKMKANYEQAGESNMHWSIMACTEVYWSITEMYWRILECT